MRSLIAVALLGVGAVTFSANAPAVAMPASSGVAQSSAAGAESSVQEVGRRHWRGHRHWGGHHRWHRRHYYRPYYYGGYSPYYYNPYRYHRRRGFGLYFGF